MLCEGYQWLGPFSAAERDVEIEREWHLSDESGNIIAWLLIPCHIGDETHPTLVMENDAGMFAWHYDMSETELGDAELQQWVEAIAGDFLGGGR